MTLRGDGAARRFCVLKGMIKLLLRMYMYIGTNFA